MKFPSTLVANAALNAIVSNVGSSHGVRLDGGSTGGTVEAFGDDANVSLKVRGQGTGGVTIGNSSQAVTLTGTALTLSGPVVVSTGVTVKGFYSTTFAWTHAAISSGQFGEVTLSTAVGDMMPGDLITIQLNNAAPVAHVGTRVSTAVASRVTIVLAVPGSSASSTLSGTGYIQWIDLT